MQTAAGGPIRRIKFTPEQIAEFENQFDKVPGTNNSGGNRYREEGVQAQQHQEQEAKRKEEEIKSRMEMRPTPKRKVTIAEKLQGKKDEYVQTPQVVGMSGADPLLSFYVGGVGLNGIGALAKTGLWNVAKYAPTTQFGNWGRGYFVGNTFKNSFNGAVPTLTSQATSLLYQPAKQNESGLTSLKFFERPSKISEAERQGKYKVERNIKQHGQPGAQYVDYSLINRNYEPWTVNERGQFVFESPEKAKKLSTIHFSLNEPVLSHIQGSWDDAPTITLLPYRNMRSQTAPADVAIMDTFFPNYNGLKVSSRGSKTLTGDKNTYEYYKNKGVDVEFSPELESLRRKIRILDKRLEMMPDSKKFSDGRYSKQTEEIYTQRRELADRMDGIVREWSSNNSKKIPSFEKLNEFGASEGFNMEKYPYSLGSPKVSYNGRPYDKYGLDYEWHTDPSNHAGSIENPKYALESAIENNLRPEYIKWLKWLINNKADYRKQGGKMNVLEFLKNGGQVRKMQTASGGPIELYDTYWVDNWKNRLTSPTVVAKQLTEQTSKIPIKYLGGSKNNVRKEFWKQEPVFQHAVDSIANQYGISPESLKYRLDREGFTDRLIQRRNDRIKIGAQRFEPRGYELLNNPNYGLAGTQIGLDDAKTYIDSGKVKLINENWDEQGPFKNEKGRMTYPVNPVTLNDGMGIVAAHLKYFRDKAQQDFPNGSEYDLDRYANAYYNRGTYGGKKWVQAGAKGYNYRKKGGMLQLLKNGSGIHIKKKNRGKFTSYCGGKVTDECIRKAKASGNPTLVKRATFAANARKWKHEKGGKAFVEGVNILDSNPNAYKYVKKKIKKNQQGGNVYSGLISTGLNAGLDIYSAYKKKEAANEQGKALDKSTEVSQQELYAKYFQEEMEKLNNETLPDGIHSSNAFKSYVAHQRANKRAQADVQKLKSQNELEKTQLQSQANQQVTSSIINGVSSLGQMLLNTKFSSKGNVNNGAPSATTPATTPTTTQ